MSQPHVGHIHNVHPGVQQAQDVMSSYMEDLKAIVNIDSGTFTKTGIDQVGQYLAGRFKDFGFSTSFDNQQTYGNNLVATHTGSAPSGPRILLIGHIDTVFAAGEVQKRPFATSLRDGKRIATGPGVLDMKSGVLIGLYGVHLLIQQNNTSYQRLTFICNSDEEIGSPGSKPLIQELASQSDAVIVLEPGRATANVVTARRSSGQYRVEVHGLSAHAGVEPQNGRNAIHELSYKVQAMQALNGTVPGTTLSVGVIRGGERTNVVPDNAYFEMDVRASDMQGIHDIEAAMRQVAAHTTIEGTTTTLSGEMLSLPFERSAQNAALVQKAKAAGKELGLDIQEISTGGASDANTTSGMGVPTIDGLGAAGGLAHNPDEYIELDSLPTRIAFLSGLVRNIGE